MGLSTSLTLGYPFSTNLDLGLAESLKEFQRIAAKELSNLVGVSHVIKFSLIITTLLLELNLTTSHDSSSDLVAIPFLFMTEANTVKGSISVFQLFIVINGSNSDLALRYIGVVIDIISKETLGLHVRYSRLQELIEDVVRPLNFLLLSNTRFLKQVGLNVTTTKLARGGEMDPNEFTKPGGVVIPGGLGITIRLQNRVSSHNLVLKRNLLFRTCLLLRSSNHSQV